MARLYDRLETYTDKPYLTPNVDIKHYMKKEDRNASLNQITTYIYQSLLDYQGKWYDSDRGVTYFWFPNARYLSVGDKIYNTTTNATYVISEVVIEPVQIIVPETMGGLVNLNLQGANGPVEGDILALDQVNTVNFESSYSKFIQNVPVTQWRDTVVYHVKRREPGTVGRHAFEPPVEAKPRTREIFPDRDHPGMHIEVKGQWFDNLIQFDCWSTLNNRSDNLIEWFEDFMFKYTWVWKKNGVNEILYWMRNEDSESSNWRNDLAVRNVNYYFRTEKLAVIKEYDFRQISLSLELGLPYPSGYYHQTESILETIQPSGSIQILDQGLSNV